MTQPSTTPPPGDPGAEPTTTPPTEPPKPPGDGGKGGDRAILADLAKERDKRQALEAQLAELAPLKGLAAALAGGQPPPPGKSAEDLLNERFAAYEADLTAERQARFRAEVAQQKGLTAEQAARLVGGNREELAADADALLALFPTPTSGGRTPAPDPSQGARGTGPGGLEQQITEAQQQGRWQDVIALKRQQAKFNQ